MEVVTFGHTTSIVTTILHNGVFYLNWTGWPLERVMLLVVGILYLVVGIQVTLFHYRQNFNKKVMWVPVIEAPLIGAASLMYVAYAADWLATFNAVLYWIAIASGLIGSVYHIRGVGKRVGGYVLRNFLVGPPAMLPSLISALGVIGLIALYWG